MSYPYTGRDLFAKPEGYDYADCASVSFLEGWHSYRARVMEALRSRSLSDTGVDETDTENHGLDSSDLTALRDILTDCCDPAGTPLDGKLATVSTLASKFEIFRRLFDTYTPKMTKAPDANPASIADYVLFAETLMAHAEKAENARLLSTLIKLADCLCTVDVDALPPATAEKLVRVLEREKMLVSRWTERAIGEDSGRLAS